MAAVAVDDALIVCNVGTRKKEEGKGDFLMYVPVCDAIGSTSASGGRHTQRKNKTCLIATKGLHRDPLIDECHMYIQTVKNLFDSVSVSFSLSIGVL